MRSACPVCGEPTKSPIVAAIYHFRPIDTEQWPYVRGNFRTFGLLSGLRANITLMFPFANTILNWKYRKHSLSLEVGEPHD